MTRTNNKDWFQIPIYEVWDICKEALIESVLKVPIDIHCFVLMSNHYHALITTPDSNIDKFMKYFNLRLSQLITKNSGVINQKFSNRYKWCIVDTQSYLKNVYRYIYQNPVRAHITDRCGNYPYSSIHFSRYESRRTNLKPHYLYSKNKAWFEKYFGKDFDEQVRLGLRRKYFKISDTASKLHRTILDDNSKYL